MIRRRLCSLVLFLLTAGAAHGSAFAQTAAKADAAYEEGKKLLADGKTAEACAKFDEARGHDPRGDILLDLGKCREKEGKTATAVAEYKEAAAAARRDKRYDREQTARQRIAVLEPKVPKLTVTVTNETSGLEVTLDGAALPKGEWGKARAIDPGDHELAAQAPGKKPFKDKVTVKVAERKTVNVPALADDAGGGAAAAAVPTGDKGAQPAAASGGDKPPPSDGGGQPAASPKGRQADRIVVEFGGFASLLYGKYDTGALDGVTGLLYEVESRDPATGSPTVRKVECTAEDTASALGSSAPCTAHFEPMAGLLVGGEIFVGYAFTPDLQLGGRAFVAPRIRGGIFLAGGPAVSYAISEPFWIGGGLLVGYSTQTANVKEVRGEVPPDVVELNGTDEVVVPPGPVTPDEATADSGFAVGGNLELSMELINVGFGSIMVSTWPTILFGTGGNGFALAAPLGFTFRYH